MQGNAERIFNVGDKVTRRPGILGNMDGNAYIGTVTAVALSGVHTILTVSFSDGREENFVRSEYTHAQ